MSSTFGEFRNFDSSMLSLDLSMLFFKVPADGLSARSAVYVFRWNNTSTGTPAINFFCFLFFVLFCFFCFLFCFVFFVLFCLVLFCLVLFCLVLFCFCFFAFCFSIVRDATINFYGLCRTTVYLSSKYNNCGLRNDY